jgi:glycosyltransferase involved in cell wall biosynthesis
MKIALVVPGGVDRSGEYRVIPALLALIARLSLQHEIHVSLAAIGITARRLPLGVDLKVWQPREPVRRDLSKPARLIHTASLNRIKDQPTLLRALASLAESGLEFQMDIVGEDTLKGEIQQMSRRLGLSTRVRFLGFLPQRDVLALVEAAHLMIISSLHEAGPSAVFEAGTLGVPTVGTAVGHIKEWAPHAAVSVPVADPNALARATALLGDEDQRLRMGHEAMRRATQEDADYTARAFQTMYAGLAG